MTLGLIAAALTSLSYIPQVRKVYVRGSTKDLSLKTLTIPFTGLSLWIVYGIIKSDMLIVIGNAVGASLVATVLLQIERYLV
jgi:MtN3 and saliva related transmembrane protein